MNSTVTPSALTPGTQAWDESTVPWVFRSLQTVVAELRTMLPQLLGQMKEHAGDAWPQQCLETLRVEAPWVDRMIELANELKNFEQARYVADHVPRFYDRAGAPIAEAEYRRLCEDESYGLVAQSKTETGLRIITLWHGRIELQSDPPPIFQTGIQFPGKRSPFQPKDFYATEAEALAGHQAFVASWQARYGSGVKP